MPLTPRGVVNLRDDRRDLIVAVVAKEQADRIHRIAEVPEVGQQSNRARRALADSLFFDMDLNAARSRVLLFLALSFAPFLFVAPLIGPMIDRMPGGRRFVISGVALSRTVLLVLAAYFGWPQPEPECFTPRMIRLCSGQSARMENRQAICWGRFTARTQECRNSPMNSSAS